MNKNTIVAVIVGVIVGSVVTTVVMSSNQRPPQKNSNRMIDHSVMKMDDSKSMQGMIDALKGKKDDEFDKVFVDLMIEHHQGAVEMAKEAQEYAKHDEIKKLADDIIAAQTKEIEMMKTWQKEWGY